MLIRWAGWLAYIYFKCGPRLFSYPKCIVEMGGERERDDFEIGFLLSFDLVVI